MCSIKKDLISPSCRTMARQKARITSQRYYEFTKKMTLGGRDEIRQQMNVFRKGRDSAELCGGSEFQEDNSRMLESGRVPSFVTRRKQAMVAEIAAHPLRQGDSPYVRTYGTQCLPASLPLSSKLRNGSRWNGPKM